MSDRTRPFEFKKFRIHQEYAAMKVGTDGVLLGAWCSAKNTAQVLDVGTGTGLLSLMIAQRNQVAIITAIEPDDAANHDAHLNFSRSHWKDRLALRSDSLENFETNNFFDLVVCNPPFYADGLVNLKEDRNRARNSASLPPELLFQKTADLLSENGVLAVIYPAQMERRVMKAASQASLFLQRICIVTPVPGKQPHRYLLEFGKRNLHVSSEELLIETGDRHAYSAAFRQLLKDFYLAF